MSMTDNVYPDRASVRKALVDAGYKSGFSSPGRPELWILGRERVATGLRSDKQWIIVPYPEPAVCTPETTRRLRSRDSVLNGGAVAPSNDKPKSSEPDDDIAAAMRLAGLT